MIKRLQGRAGSLAQGWQQRQGRQLHWVLATEVGKSCSCPLLCCSWCLGKVLIFQGREGFIWCSSTTFAQSLAEQLWWVEPCFCTDTQTHPFGRPTVICTIVIFAFTLPFSSNFDVEGSGCCCEGQSIWGICLFPTPTTALTEGIQLNLPWFRKASRFTFNLTQFWPMQRSYPYTLCLWFTRRDPFTVPWLPQPEAVPMKFDGCPTQLKLIGCCMCKYLSTQNFLKAVPRLGNLSQIWLWTPPVFLFHLSHKSSPPLLSSTPICGFRVIRSKCHRKRVHVVGISPWSLSNFSLCCLSVGIIVIKMQVVFKGPEFLFILYQYPLLFLEIFCLCNIRQDVTGTTRAQDTHIHVSWNSLAATVPWDILPPLPPQGRSWAASRTNIPIIDEAAISQRQVLAFDLLLQLFQCLFWGFQAADAIPSASLSVHRSCCSLSSHHCCLLVKGETSEWHLCNRRAGMETWHVCAAPWVHRRALMVTPKPTTRWGKDKGCKGDGWGEQLRACSSSPLSWWRHPCITHLPSATDELEYHGYTTCTHRTVVGSLSSTLAMNIPPYLLLS